MRTSSPDTTIYHKAFHDIFGDAVWFAQEADRIQGPDTALHVLSRYTRNAILSTGLAIECAANCCLEYLSVHTNADDDLEHLRPLAKLDVFLLACPQQNRLDRNNQFVKKAHNLVSIRNRYVHAKVTPKAYTSTGQGLAEASKAQRDWKPIMIPRNQAIWKVDHAKTAVVALVDFLNYFFFVAGPFDDGSIEDRQFVKQILSSEVDSRWEQTPTEGRQPLHEFGSEGIHGPLSDEWSLDFAFLGIVSLKDGKDIVRPSDKLKEE